MTEEEKRQFTNRLNALSDAIDELNYKLGKKTGRGSNDIKGALIKSVNFVSGSAGWQLTPDGDFEASSGTFRGTLSGGTIIGSTITGGTIQTATSGKRIVIASNTIEFYNATPTNVASLNAGLLGGTTFFQITSPQNATFFPLQILQKGASTQGAIFIQCEDDGAGAGVMELIQKGDKTNLFLKTFNTSSGIGIELDYQGIASQAVKVTSSDASNIVTVGSFQQLNGPGYALEALGGNNSAREALFASKTAATISVARFKQSAVTSSNFWKILRLDGGTEYNEIWMSDGTTPNTNLTGRQGDLCLNGPGGQPFYNNNSGTGWTGM